MFAPPKLIDYVLFPIHVLKIENIRYWMVKTPRQVKGSAYSFFRSAKKLELMTEFAIDFRNRTLYAEKQLG